MQNSANGAQEMTFDLDFLGEGDWYADIYYDNLNVAATVKRRVEQVTKETPYGPDSLRRRLCGASDQDTHQL